MLAKRNKKKLHTYLLWDSSGGSKFKQTQTNLGKLVNCIAKILTKEEKKETPTPFTVSFWVPRIDLTKKLLVVEASSSLGLHTHTQTFAPTLIREGRVTGGRVLKTNGKSFLEHDEVYQKNSWGWHHDPLPIAGP